ncbi:hypothetical protein ACS0TY_024323 [Phlomoides rotata]
MPFDGFGFAIKNPPRAAELLFQIDIQAAVAWRVAAVKISGGWCSRQKTLLHSMS